MKNYLLIIIALLAPGVVCAQQSDVAYVSEIDQWHSERLERLRLPNGWLSLVGLHSINDGINTVGSDADANVQLIDKAPANVGTITLKGENLQFTAFSGVEVLVAGGEPRQPITSIALASDQSGEPTVLELGSLSFYVIYRDGLRFLRVKDSQSEILKNFKGIDRYPVQDRWRISAHLEGGPEFTAVPNVLGQTSQSPSPGVLVFTIGGKEYRLTPQGEPGQSMFIVFGDATNGSDTYPGGRFLSVDAPQADGTVLLDFNKSTNPPCVFTPFATCPMPSLNNIIKVPIEAGEKIWGDHH